VVGNSLTANAPAGIRCDNVRDHALLGNTVTNTVGVAGIVRTGRNDACALLGNVASDWSKAPRSKHGILIEAAPPPGIDPPPENRGGIVNATVQDNVCVDALASTNQGLKVGPGLGKGKPASLLDQLYTSGGGGGQPSPSQSVLYCGRNVM
jgi:hypothetical protein